MLRALALLVAVGLVTVAPAGGASAAPAQAPGCDIESAELTWGFKESFRAYIDGSIANGEWTVADGATYDTPAFGWSGGAGSLNPVDLAGDLAFSGSVRFTGHGGVLDTTIAKPVIRFESADRATLLLDVSGPTMAGDPFSAVAVPFVEIDLTGVGVVTRQGDTVLIDGAPTTLTTAGSDAFPNYEAGTEFDPMTVAFVVGDDCEFALADGLIGDATPFYTLVAIIAALLLAAVAVVGIIVVRRRR